jgi:hypothetical protein
MNRSAVSGQTNKMLNLSNLSLKLKMEKGKELTLGDTIRVKYLPTGSIIEATYIRHEFGKPGLVKLQHEMFAVYRDPDAWQILDD